MPDKADQHLELLVMTGCQPIPIKHEETGDVAVMLNIEAVEDGTDNTVYMSLIVDEQLYTKGLLDGIEAAFTHAQQDRKEKSN